MSNYLKDIKKQILKHSDEPTDLDELARAVVRSINNYRKSHCGNKVEPRVVGFAWDVKHGNVSNTHCQPIDGVSNWLGQKDLPNGYPGWTGRVWIRYAEPIASFGCDPFRATLTYPGTGGAGSYDGPWKELAGAWFARHGGHGGKKLPKDAYPEPELYSWDYRFFDSDWPLIQDWIEKQELLTHLTGKSWTKRHYYRWTDPEVADADLHFLCDPETISAVRQHEERRKQVSWFD